jgi:hypothetical protein
MNYVANCGVEPQDYKGTLMKDFLGPQGSFHVKHIRDGEVIAEFDQPNVITTEGKNHLLNVVFHGATPLTSWYIGLIDSVGYTAVAAGNTYAEIGGTNAWSEDEDYTDDANSDSDVTRPLWIEDAASSGSISGSSPSVFNIDSNGTLKGLFVCAGANAQTKGDSTNTGNILWCATLFTAGDRAVLNGDTLEVTYTITT